MGNLNLIRCNYHKVLPEWVCFSFQNQKTYYLNPVKRLTESSVCLNADAPTAWRHHVFIGGTRSNELQKSPQLILLFA